MADLKGSKTAENIMAAFQGESMARNRYTFYEEQAKKEGNQEIASLFAKMSKNESFHARLWFKLLYGAFESSEKNLQSAAAGENSEWKDMYPEFAKVAREEGFEDIAQLFEQVAGIEHDHEIAFIKAYVELKSKTDEPAPQAAEEKPLPERPVYRCQFCGALFETRPDVCNVCGAIGSFEQGYARY